MKSKDVIGQFEYVDIIDAGINQVPARVDTGARTSAIWASDITETDGELSYAFFGQGSSFYTGTKHSTTDYTRVVVATSTGEVQSRYKVPLTLSVHGRRIKSYCTLADRSTQAFPLLLGRNTLKGKFIVDVQNGPAALDELDQDRSIKLQSLL